MKNTVEKVLRHALNEGEPTFSSRNSVEFAFNTEDHNFPLTENEVTSKFYHYLETNYAEHSTSTFSDWLYQIVADKSDNLFLHIFTYNRLLVINASLE